MSNSKLNDWLQLGASIGVILSLVFVGLEIQQSRQIAIADIHQQRAAMAIQVQQGNYGDDRYTRILMKYLSSEPLSDSEISELQFRQNPWFSYWENGYFQYRMGLLSESTWLSSREAMKRRLSSPIYQEWWENERGTWDSDFAQEVDDLLLEIRSGE